MKLDLSKLLEISARTAGAISISCAILLFFPQELLPFDVVGFRVTNGIWIFIVFVVSISMWVSYLFKWIIEVIKREIELHNRWKTYKYILEHLSNEEKIFLKEYYDKRETAIIFNLQNPVHKRLQTIQVISMAAGRCIGTASTAPGFIQSWVFDLIDKNPSYLEIQEIIIN